MINLASLLRDDRKKDAWTRYCGFVNLSLADYLRTQERLLKEQIGFLSNCSLGKRLLDGNVPGDISEFRESVPLTTYSDYVPHLPEKRDDVLPAKPRYWICTTGEFGSYDEKWAPYSPGMVQVHTKNFLASIIFSICTGEGEFTLKEKAKFLYGMAPPPYITGMVPYGLKEEFPLEYLPPLAEAEKMTFGDRNKEGFNLGMRKGVDLFFGVSSVLVRIGENFTQGKGTKSGPRNFHPWAGLRLIHSLAKSKLQRRDLLPKDVWHLKGIICAGTDTNFYRDRIKYYWGKEPLAIYGGTEIGIAATQTWKREGMVLFPDANFWEFIPEDEYYRSKSDPGYSPSTILLPDLVKGKRYELVITNFNGGAFVRYRMGDMVSVLSSCNDNESSNLPQIIYEDRVDDVIDLAAFTRINERTIWEALKTAGISQGEWFARKSFRGKHPVLELYLETNPIEIPEEIEERIHNALRCVDSDYHDLEEIMGFKPFRLVPVPPGSIQLTVRKLGKGKDGWASGLNSRVHPSEKIVAEINNLRAV